MTEFEAAVEAARREYDATQYANQMQIRLEHILLIVDVVAESAEEGTLMPPAWIASMMDTIKRDVETCQRNLNHIR
jgi:hypothetical protein